MGAARVVQAGAAVPSNRKVVASQEELIALADVLSLTSQGVQTIAQRVGALVGTLDRRGWNAGAADAAWGAAQSRMASGVNSLADTRSDLLRRAGLVELIDTPIGFPRAPGTPFGPLLPPALGAPLPPGWVPGQPTGNAALDRQARNVRGRNDSPFPLAPWDTSKMGDDFFAFPGRGENSFSRSLFPNRDPRHFAGSYGYKGGKVNTPAWLKHATQNAKRLAGRRSRGLPGPAKNAYQKVGVKGTLNIFHGSVKTWKTGNKDNGASVELLSAHAQAAGGVNFDWRRKRLGVEGAVHAEANLVKVEAHGKIGKEYKYAGVGAEGRAEAAVGAHATAKAGLTADAKKGIRAQAGFDAMAGAHASADTNVNATVMGAKAQADAKGTVYAGVGATAKAKGTFDPLSGKFGFHGKVGLALGVGGSVEGGVEIDLSKAPGKIADAAEDVGDFFGL